MRAMRRGSPNPLQLQRRLARANALHPYPDGGEHRHVGASHPEIKMKKYLILMTNDDAAWNRLTSSRQQQVIEEHAAFHDALETEHKFLLSHRLRTTDEARSVTRNADGKFTSTSGGYLAGGRSMGGFYLIEAESMDEALEWAKRCRFIEGTNIVHEVWE